MVNQVIEDSLQGRLSEFLQKRAYFIWEERGRPLDSAQSDWEKARSEFYKKLLRHPEIQNPAAEQN